jgi:hypothetical protein
MTDEQRSAAQARVREKVARRSTLARRKTAERKLVRWAGEVGPDALEIVAALYPMPGDPSPKFETEEDLRHALFNHGKATVMMPPAGMPPPPKFEDER